MNKIALSIALAVATLTAVSAAKAEEIGTERFSVDYVVNETGKAKPAAHATPATIGIHKVMKTNYLPKMRKAPRNPQPVVIALSVDDR